MAAASLGAARCPLCGGTARVSLSKSSYAVMTMNCCNAQLFTRSPRSDELVRDLIRPAAPGAVLPEVKPEPVRTVPPAPAPEKPEAPAPAPAKKTGFGLMGSWV